VSTPKPPERSGNLPTFFTDRDLGRLAFPDGLRAAGLAVVTIFDHYGVEASQTVADDEWLPEAARRGWPVLCCDSKHRKRRRPAERAALLDSRVQEFVLNGNVPAAENVTRVMRNLAAIVTACRSPGPFVYRVHPARIERLNLGR
jgi:hypothetical protein